VSIKTTYISLTSSYHCFKLSNLQPPAMNLTCTVFPAGFSGTMYTQIVEDVARRQLIEVHTKQGTGVAQSVKCLTRDRTNGVRSPAEIKNFSSSVCAQTSFEALPASYPMGTGCLSPGGKARPRREADHSHPSSAEVENE
jgi:hypothetical protein